MSRLPPLTWTSLCPSDDSSLARTIAQRSLRRRDYLQAALDEIAGRLTRSGWAWSSVCDEVLSIFRAVETERARLLNRPPPPPLEREGWASWPDQDRPRRGARPGSWWGE